jgi:hypothetical protein
MTTTLTDIPTARPVADDAVDVLFREARTHNAWLAWFSND